MKNNQQINRKDFEKLLQNNSEQDQSTFDDFDKDALEGWKNSGVAFSQMKNVDKAIGRKFNNGFFNSTVFIGSIAAILTVSAIIFFTQQENTPSPKQKSFVIERNEVSLPENIDTLIALNKETQISTQDLISKHTQEQAQTQTKTEIVQKVDFDLLTSTVLEPLPTTIENKEVKLTEQRLAKEIYLHRLKAIDYSEYRSRPEVKIEQIILSGVPASYETEDDIQTESSTKTVMIPYMDYLDKTLKYLGNEKWKQALSRCEEILNTYPDDINAIFYSGLCYYNLQQYQKACDQFSACVQLNWANFNEEATWYLAKSRLANKDKTLAKELFTAIKENNGYYAKQAEKILKEWK